MAFAISTLTTVINPLQTFRRLPGVSVLTERQWGGFLVFSGLVGIGVGLGAAGLAFRGCHRIIEQGS